MKLGYFTMPLHPPGSDFTWTLESDLEQIITLDELGFQEAWLGEHFTSVWENIPAPDLVLASAIPQTQNIILGIGVNLYAQPQSLRPGLPHRSIGPHVPRAIPLGHRIWRFPGRFRGLRLRSQGG